MYKIYIIPQAIKDLEKLPHKSIKQIKEKIINLANSPRCAQAVKLTVEDGYRIRAGDYRIVYRISDKEKIIYIYRIKHRKDAYR